VEPVLKVAAPDVNNRDRSGYDTSIQPDQANPSCKSA
jgi:hypothetical protein